MIPGLYRYLREHQYTQSLALIIALLLYGGIAAVIGTSYAMLYGVDNIIVRSYAVALLVVILLVTCLFFTRKLLWVAYAAAGLYTVHIYIIALYGMETIGQTAFFWFAITPGFLVFRLVFSDLLWGGCALGLVMVELQCRIAGVPLLSGAVPLFQQHPQHLLTLIFVLLFSLGCAFMLFFMLKMYDDHCQSAQRDHLTGLYNRRMLDQDGQHLFRCLQEQGDDYSTIFVDLDRFKEINDLFGHEAGDYVLTTIGQQMRALCDHYNAHQKGGMDVYRFGGDEFLFLLSPRPTLESLQHLLQQLDEVTAVVSLPNGQHFAMGSSLGVAQSALEADSFNELLHFADILMYVNKKESRRQVQSKKALDPVQHWHRTFSIYKGLPEAINRQQLRLVYQPVFNTQSLQVEGCEALLRWDSEHYGEVLPEEFIPVAEVTGIIHSLSLWVVDTVLKDLAQWTEKNADFTCSVNISPGQLGTHYFIQQLQKIITNTSQACWKNLVFEFTESNAVLNSKTVRYSLSQLRQLGVRLSVDDYGQGNTSFLSLQDTAFQIIKLDKHLLWAAEKDALKSKVLETIVCSAHDLGLQVTAGGIETEEQLTLAQQLGCEISQGYLLSRPLSASELSSYLNA